MKNFAIIAGLLGMALSAQAQYGIAPGSVAGEQAEPSPTQTYLHILPAEEDTFATYIYTFGDIVIFSYEDSARAEIADQSGNVIWSGDLNADEYAFRRTGEGIYQVRCNKEFSVLIGDPLSQIVQGWHAVDQHSRPLSNKFLTVMQGSWVSGAHAGRERFCVFAYYDNTDVTVKNLVDGTVIWTGTLDSLQRWETWRSVQVGLPVSVEATKEVSVLSYGDCGYYAPAFNGTFTGRDFITFCGNMGGTNMIPWPQALKVIPWEDNTNVVVTDLDNPADTLWKFFVAKKGDIQSRNYVGRFLKIHSDKDISCAMIPGQAACYFHLVRSIDRNGLGLGKEFYIPTLAACNIAPYYPHGKIDLFAFYDDTEVRIFKMPNERTPVWEGTLNTGGHHRLMTEPGSYKVEASRGVAVIESAGDRAGADFLPLWFAIHPAVAAYPDQFKDTECLVPTSQTDDGAYEVYVENNGNIWDVINIFTENSLDPDFVTSLSDELGRTLPDVDGDGNPDTDTLPKSGYFIVLADVTPSEMLPFGTTDTCFFSIVSMRDTTRLDTAFLVTTIREVKIMVDPDTFVTEYPRNTKVIPVAAYSTSLYREDTVNLTYHSTQDSLTWPVSFTDTLGVPLQDTDGNDTLDVPGVPTDSVAAPFQVRVSVPDSALAGDRDTIYLIATSGNYPFGSIYPETIDTTVLIVEVEAVAGLLIVPDTLDSVPSGQTIRYPLEVFNYGNGPDVADITFEPGQSDWVHRLVDKDGINDLADTDGDGIPDLDTLAGLVAGVPGFDMLYLDVTPPYWALPGLFDSTIVYAHSSISDTVYDSAIVVTRTRNIVALDIEPDTNTIIGPGEEAVYLLRVTNLGSTYDIIDIGSYAAPDLGWSHTLSFEDGTPLLDEDNDGVPDLGSVDSAKMVVARLVVRPHEELGSIAGAFDATVTEHRIVWIRTYYTDDPTLVNDSVLIMTRFEPVLDIHNYPNPFSGSTTFAFSIPREGLVTLRIYNRAGEHIRTLIDEVFYEFGGIFEAHWDGLTESGHRPAPGVYIYTLGWRELRTDEESEEFSTAQRITKAALLQP